MKAVILDISRAELARRNLTGESRRDEVWEGVLHLSPAPTYEHQRIIDRLVAFLLPLVEMTGRGIIVSGINVFRTDSDYRIPDLSFVARSRERVLTEDGVRGGPDAVIEVRSPSDETYEKLPFYAAIGVHEVAIIPRDDKLVEIHRLSGSGYVAIAPDRDAFLHSEAHRVRFKCVPGPPARLIVEDVDDSTQHTSI